MTSENDSRGDEGRERPQGETPSPEGRRPRRRRRRRRTHDGDAAPSTSSPRSAEAPSSGSGPARSDRPDEPAGRESSPDRAERPRRERTRQRTRGDDRPRADRSREDRPRRDRGDSPRSGSGRDDRPRGGDRAGSRDAERSRDRGRSRPRSDEGRDDAPRPERRPTKRPDRRAPREDGLFTPFDLPDPVLLALEDCGYEEPTEIQERLIPLALEGHDVVARSRTGTGKTCAFFVPALSLLDEIDEPEDTPPHGPPRVLVVVPTRELAIQVAEEGGRLARYLPLRVSCIYGGTEMRRQFKEMPLSAVVVGTPGRLLDHLRRGTLDGSKIELLVLDEVDRMYDLGFRDDVDRIMAACRERKQTLLVSATLNEDVERLVGRHLREHERIEIASSSLTVDEVEQTFYVVHPDRKRELLMALFRARAFQRTIVFVRTRFTADRVAYVLKQEGFDAEEIHGGLPQRRRESILRGFRDGKLSILVATDVAARGLDIRGVDHVVNYDIPQSPEDYVHRVGRTARMGKEGWAVTLVVPDDGPFLTEIEKLINKEISQEFFEGFELPDTPERRRARPEEAAPEPDAPDEDADVEDDIGFGEIVEGPATPAKPRAIPRWDKPKKRRR